MSLLMSVCARLPDAIVARMVRFDPGPGSLPAAASK
jgi:hypothetical protein